MQPSAFVIVLGNGLVHGPALFFDFSPSNHIVTCSSNSLINRSTVAVSLVKESPGYNAYASLRGIREFGFNTESGSVFKPIPDK